jgi:hypothetical protein
MVHGKKNSSQIFRRILGGKLEKREKVVRRGLGAVAVAMSHSMRSREYFGGLFMVRLLGSDVRTSCGVKERRVGGNGRKAVR